ncbi:unnamed protein product [Peniophora sp. CBMAI 1063]|nr:unnamed protein product [Peniophora sp. CBMAI 1063]
MTAKPVRESTLSVNQKKFVKAILKDEFEPYVRESDPDLSGFHAVTDWASARRARIFDEVSIFKTAHVRKNILLYKQAVDRKFRNFYYRLRPRTAAGTSSSSTSIPVPASSRLSSLTSYLVPPTTGFQLFEWDVKQSLLDSEETAVEGSDAYRTRLKQMWDDLEEGAREEYEEDVDTVANNVEHSRKLLLTNFVPLLDALCRDRALGNMMATVLVAYRDADGTTQVHIREGRCVDDCPQFGVTEEEKSILEAFKDAWKKYADSYIPVPPRPAPPSPSPTPDTQKIEIPYHLCGMPVFPLVKLSHTPSNELKALIIRYLVAVWASSREAHHPLELPWADIIRNPTDFYDVERFNFMNFDRDTYEDPLQVYPFVVPLQQSSNVESRAEELFTFRFAPEVSSLRTPSLGPPNFEASFAEGEGFGATDLSQRGPSCSGGETRETAGMEQQHVDADIARETQTSSPAASTRALSQKRTNGPATAVSSSQSIQAGESSHLDLPPPSTGKRRVPSVNAVSASSIVARTRSQNKRAAKETDIAGNRMAKLPVKRRRSGGVQDSSMTAAPTADRGMHDTSDEDISPTESGTDGASDDDPSSPEDEPPAKRPRRAVTKNNVSAATASKRQTVEGQQKKQKNFGNVVSQGFELNSSVR